MSVTFEDIVEARKRIADGIYDSPCPESIPLSEIADCRVYCKLDYLQRTGSFKERGARNALLQLDEARKKRGVIAASAGNHALGLAYHGMLLGVPVTVVMPKFAPLVKVTTCRRMQARVVLHGETFGEAKQKAQELAAAEGLTYVHGFDDAPIIAGQGTMGLEIVEQVPNLEAIVVPVGGAGLIAGVGLAIKHLKPNVEVIGVEPINAASFSAALEAGRPVETPTRPTLADGLAVPQVGDRAFMIARQVVDLVVQVTEEHLALAILRIAEREKGVVEGAGAAPLAAFLAGELADLKGKRVVMPFCGGNIDPIVLSRVIEKGLAADGRLCHFIAQISDRPGGLAKFAALIATTGASIKEITHDRIFSGGDVSATNVLCVLETRDQEHIEQIHQMMRDNSIRFFLPEPRTEAEVAAARA